MLVTLYIRNWRSLRLALGWRDNWLGDLFVRRHEPPPPRRRGPRTSLLASPLPGGALLGVQRACLHSSCLSLSGWLARVRRSSSADVAAVAAAAASTVAPLLQMGRPGRARPTALQRGSLSPSTSPRAHSSHNRCWASTAGAKRALLSPGHCEIRSTNLERRAQPEKQRAEQRAQNDESAYSSPATRWQRATRFRLPALTVLAAAPRCLALARSARGADVFSTRSAQMRIVFTAAASRMRCYCMACRPNHAR